MISGRSRLLQLVCNHLGHWRWMVWRLSDSRSPSLFRSAPPISMTPSSYCMSLPVFPHMLLRGSSALNRRGDHVHSRHLQSITVPVSFAFAMSMPLLHCHFWFRRRQMSKLCWQHERSPKSSLGDCALISPGAICRYWVLPQTRLVALSRMGDNLKWTGDNEDLQTRAAVTDEVPVFGRLRDRVTGFEAEKSKHCWSLEKKKWRTMFRVLSF